MKKIFSCSTSQFPVDKWNRHDQKFWEAVEKGDAKKVSSLLTKRQIRATKTGPGGQSAFHLAASRGFADCVSVILSHKVEINAKTDDGCTALHLASSNCHPECVKLLLQHGAHEDSIDFHSRTPLHCAATSGCVSSVLLLCDAEDTVLDAADDDGRTPLMIAAQRNHPTVCSLLLDRGAQVDLFDRDMKTALILSCEKGNIQAAETLITKGADATLRDNKGCDALHYTDLSRDDSLRRLVQAALDRRKNHELHSRNYDSPSASKAVPQTPSREQELVFMWKKRYEEEQKRGVWLQGDLMMKTQDLERMSEEHRLECSRIRDLVGTLDCLLEGDGEKTRPKSENYQYSDTCDLLEQLLEKVKSFKDQRQKEHERQEEIIQDLSAKPSETGMMEDVHQEEMRRLQGEAAAAKEREESGRRRVAELEGHLENMREVLSQFEKRKRIQSTVVEDLQDQISGVTREKEELLVLLQKLQEQEGNVDDVQTERLENGQDIPNNKILSDFIKKCKSNCIHVDIKQGNGISQGCSGYVPKDVLEKNVNNWKSSIAGLENYMAAVERLQKSVAAVRSERTDSVLINSAKGEQNSGHRLVKDTKEHHKQLETNIACLQAEETHRSRNSITPVERSGSAQDLAKTTDSLKQKITDLETQLSSLKGTNENLLTRMNQVVQEKQNLEEGLLALQESMQSEFAMRQETEKRCKDYKHQILVLSDELLAEQDKLKKLNGRLEAQQNEMAMLRDSFPPEIIREESSRSVEMFSSDVLEELYWNVGTLVRKYNDALQEAAALQKENLKLLDDQAQTISMTEHKNILNEIKNQLHSKTKETEDLKQRLFQTMGNVVELKEQLAAQTSNSIPKEEFESRLVDLERIVTALKEENEACKVALEGKCEEVLVLKQQMEQETEEGQALRLKEVSMVQEMEKVRAGLETKIQALREEVQGLSEKYTQASKDAEGWRANLSFETEKVLRLEGKIQELMKEADDLRIQSKKYEEENRHLTEQCEHVSKASQEKQEKMLGSMKEVESLTKEIDRQQKRYEELSSKLEETNKRHQEIISIYRTHLLNAAQGLMDEDVHFTLHWILKMQKELVY
ncbi:ankyrin repeat domain-containing protein 35 isoform X2 [Hyla sarda]|uniref:ankyrin repeat domain-containing protein 35 isoform X2 n=1 Tax=Hyla sarda TaxID=327740 RepID=UPI0024C2B010|nr:ankyrin repeat domain-containing protein 35 isoform X2 [Hyla sarda]